MSADPHTPVPGAASVSADPHTPVSETRVSPLGRVANLEETVVIVQGNLFALSLRDGRLLGARKRSLPAE